MTKQCMMTTHHTTSLISLHHNWTMKGAMRMSSKEMSNGNRGLKAQHVLSPRYVFLLFSFLKILLLIIYLQVGYVYANTNTTGTHRTPSACRHLPTPTQSSKWLTETIQTQERVAKASLSFRKSFFHLYVFHSWFTIAQLWVQTNISCTNIKHRKGLQKLPFLFISLYSSIKSMYVVCIQMLAIPGLWTHLMHFGLPIPLTRVWGLTGVGTGGLLMTLGSPMLITIYI